MLQRLREPMKIDRLADAYFSDEQIGRLVRLGVHTWEDFSNFSLNQIAQLPHFGVRNLNYIREEWRARNIPLKTFDAFGLISGPTRNLLNSAGIRTARQLYAKRPRELRQLPRFGDTRVRECEECLALADLILRPDQLPDVPTPLRDVGNRMARGMSSQQIADDLGIHLTTVTARRQRIKSAIHHADWVKSQIGRWKSQPVEGQEP